MEGNFVEDESLGLSAGDDVVAAERARAFLRPLCACATSTDPDSDTDPCGCILAVVVWVLGGRETANDVGTADRRFRAKKC